MIRGTTHVIYFHITNEEINLSDIKEAWICLRNKEIEYNWKYSTGKVFIDPAERMIYVALSQAETLSFVNDDKVFIQLRVLLNDDTALASEISKIEIKEILKDGVISL